MSHPQILAIAIASLAMPALGAVDFVKEVKPILEQNCVRCHNPKGTEFEAGDKIGRASCRERV